MFQYFGDLKTPTLHHHIVEQEGYKKQKGVNGYQLVRSMFLALAMRLKLAHLAWFICLSIALVNLPL